MKKPRILFYDIETAPNLGYTWGKYDQNVMGFAKEWYMLSFSWKWLGEKTVHCRSLRSYRGKTREKQLVKALHSLLAKADVTVAHNGDKFDNMKSKTRMAFYKLSPSKITATVDTLKVYKKYFHLNSYSLGAIAEYFKFTNQKQKDLGLSLWLGCMNDEAKSWSTMEAYNKQDVRVLEEAYTFVLPWMHTHPNMSRSPIILPDPEKGCPKCGSHSIIRKGFRLTNTRKQQLWLCHSCKGWFQTAVSSK